MNSLRCREIPFSYTFWLSGTGTLVSLSFYRSYPPPPVLSQLSEFVGIGIGGKPTLPCHSRYNESLHNSGRLLSANGYRVYQAELTGIGIAVNLHSFFLIPFCIIVQPLLCHQWFLAIKLVIPLKARTRVYPFYCGQIIANRKSGHKGFYQPIIGIAIITRHYTTGNIGVAIIYGHIIYSGLV